MKKIITIFLVVFSSLVFSQQTDFIYIKDCGYFRPSNVNQLTNTDNNLSVWQSFQTPTTGQITDLQFNGSLGWGSHTAMGVVYTTNSGMNWNAVSFMDTTFNTTFNGIFFIDNFTGWSVGGAVSIRKTTNGGLNWFRQIPPAIAGILNSVYFFDANTGLAMGRKGANSNSCVIRTTNGGTNWTEITASTANENELMDQYWFNSSTGWVCGKSFLKKSTDGGLTYTDFYSCIPPTSNGVNGLLCIYFVNAQTGWIGGSNLDHKNLYVTTNGGNNWTFQDNPVANYTYAQINDVRIMSNGTGYAAHGVPGEGAILFTTNFGTNWVIDYPSTAWFDCLWIYNNFNVYCGASGGVVWYSTVPTGISGNSNNVPDKFLLSQNYPNPFNQSTIINVQLPVNGQVKIDLFDYTGKFIKTLINQRQTSGNYNLRFNGEEFSSGVYFYTLSVDGKRIDTKKMVMIK